MKIRTKKVNEKLLETTAAVIDYANKNDISKRELVKLLLAMLTKDRLIRFGLLILLIISVVWNVLQFIF